jgi:hypothetical protein
MHHAHKPLDISTISRGGQRIGRSGRNLSIRPRLAGVLVTASLMVGLALLLRGTRSAAPAAPRRGGQIVASTVGEPHSFNRLVAQIKRPNLSAFSPRDD